MPYRPNHWIAAAIGLLALLWAGMTAYGQQPAAETVRVAKTFDNAPFDYRIRPLGEHADFRVYRLTYPSPLATPLPQNNTVPADYYLPKGISQDGRRYPAVICLHILDGNEVLTDLVCSVLASRGVPAISFKLPYYGERGTAKGPEALATDPKLFVGAIKQAGLDIRRTFDVLASRPEIDPDRIGIAGISLGGIIAASAAGAEPRLHRASLILSGGDLTQIIHHARETQPLSAMIKRLPPQERAEVEARIAEVDPLRFAAGLRDRARAGRVLMINAERDEVIPRACTEKLVDALGIADRVVWLQGLGHYTALAELPRALRMTADFFAQDLPEGTRPPISLPAVDRPTPLRTLVAILQQAAAVLSTEPSPGHCHFVDVELSASDVDRRPITAQVRFVRGAQGKFSLRCQLPQIGEVALGQGRFPWMLAGGATVLEGTKNAVENDNPLNHVAPRHMQKLRMISGLVETMALAPEVLERWIVVTDQKAATVGGVTDHKTATVGRAPDEIAGAPRVIRITAKDPSQLPGEIRLLLRDDGRTPASAGFAVGGMEGTLYFRGWQTNTIASDALFEPPERPNHQAVDQADLYRIFSAMLNFAGARMEPVDRPNIGPPSAISVVARDPAGHGLLCRSQGKTILMVSGTPAEMGAAHGALLSRPTQELAERVLYLVGGGDTIHSGQWFFDRMAEIERRTTPHIPPRFFEECDALGKAAHVSARDARYANLFPERFHCSGVALRGKATAGGRVLHARVLDYMTEIDLQEGAALMVFMPEGRYKWMSLGYAGFIGTVTAMNEKGLAIGEMGGRGEGQWDGMPMNLLLRDVVERAATVEEALKILRETPRTCEYYYVLSDRSGTLRGVHCLPREMTVLEPGQQDPRLPHVPEDTVIMSGEDRAKLLGQRIQERYGRIDVPALIEIIKRPVSMHSNLHDAIFAPETLEMWFANAGRFTPACDEPYAHVNLGELIQFYTQQSVK